MISDHHIALVAIGGLTGAISRHRIDSRVSSRIKHHIPFGTLTVNLFGSFVIGLAYELFKHHIMGSEFEIFIITGFLGAFTTFSSYSLHTLNLFEENKFREGFTNLFLNNFLGIFMVFLGTLAGSGIWHLTLK